MPEAMPLLEGKLVVSASCEIIIDPAASTRVAIIADDLASAQMCRKIAQCKLVYSYKNR